MTDLTRVAAEALLDEPSAIIWTMTTIPEGLHLTHQGVIARSVQPCDGPLRRPPTSPANSLPMIRHDKRTRPTGTGGRAGGKGYRDVSTMIRRGGCRRLCTLILGQPIRLPASGVETLAALRAGGITLRVLCEDRFPAVTASPLPTPCLRRWRSWKGAAQSCWPDCMYDGRNIVILSSTTGRRPARCRCRAALATARRPGIRSPPTVSPEEAQFSAVRHHERFGPLDEKGSRW